MIMAFNKAFGLCAIALISLVLLPAPAAAFGAGNIASIARIEGHNWRHGDIEDVLKTIAFLKGHKWTSLMIKRVYFGNWLRDYSQAVDVGTLKGVQAEILRVLVWILSFLAFGYCTGEFEPTAERLGVYRPEEHIDNPKDYADNADARRFDPRLRPPVMPAELAVDPYTGMKNYIANETGGWATSSGYIKFSLNRSIHFGRVYTSGANGTDGKEADLCEALRCLGQALHCLEDFSAHSNYVELALRELGFHHVFPHTGTGTELDVRGRRVFPLVTGTFGAVDFLHSVLGEFTDQITQTEVEQMDLALGDAQLPKESSSRRPGGSRQAQVQDQFIGLLNQLPGAGGGLAHEALRLREMANAQEDNNLSSSRGLQDPSAYGGDARATSLPEFPAPPGTAGGPPAPGIPGLSPNIDPLKIVAQIYPILEFHDKIVKTISGILEMVPGLHALCERISETVTLFVLSLLAPFVRPIINAVSNKLKEGSTAVVDASGRHQFEVWTDTYCSDPTHSLLSKDHFSNVLNEVAGQVAVATVQYVAPRVIYAWSHPDVPVPQVLNDIIRVLHHPAIRDPNCEIHRNMFDVVQKWAKSRSDRGAGLNDILSSESVKRGRNHSGKDGHHHGPLKDHGSASHSKVRGSEWEKIRTRSAPDDDDDEQAASLGPGNYPPSAYQQQQQPPPPAFEGYQAPPGDQYQQAFYPDRQPPNFSSTNDSYAEPYQHTYQESSQNMPPSAPYPTQDDPPYYPQSAEYGDQPSQYGYDAPSGQYVGYEPGTGPPGQSGYHYQGGNY